jgi:NAD(P)-dependent dehydrogenase (short-subunit alcohol dehydrogenase family)
MDVRDLEATFGLATRVKEEVGGVEILVPNAAVTTAGPLVDPIPEDWDWVFDSVLGGSARGLQAFLTAVIDWVTDKSWSPPPWSVLYRISSSCMDPTQQRKRWRSGW